MYFITLFLSAFVCSTSLALNQFDLSVIEDYMLYQNKLPETAELGTGVNTAELDSSIYKYKGQSVNNTRWDELNEHEWLSFSIWKKELALKKNDSAWRNDQQSLLFSEKMGKVIKCTGRCYNYRGVTRVKAEHLTQLREGDEFVTANDSAAWIFLMDGSLVKLSPNTSITLQEINISDKEFFVMIRLNKGYMNFIPRSINTLLPKDIPESDLSMLPVKIKKANREYHAIQKFRKLGENEQISFSMLKNPGVVGQYEMLNKLIEENNQFMTNRRTRYYLFTPNFSIEGGVNPAHLFYEPNGKGLFSVRENMEFNTKEKTFSDVVVRKRGYTAQETLVPDKDLWYEVNRDGQQIIQTNQGLKFITASLAFLKRVPSILLAREVWLQKVMKPMLEATWSEKEIAEKFGYRIWDINDPLESKKRISFIREYIRRIETTNLVALFRLLKDEKLHGFDQRYIQKAMEQHYITIKSFYSTERMKIFRFSNIDYYLWILKNG